MDARVRSVCDILGFDPIYMANEGKMIVIAPAVAETAVLGAMKGHPIGSEAAVIGSVKEGAGVSLRTVIGGERPVVMLEGVQLPRIC
jgi:hydrogenase expression/formation protein HypE